MYAPIFDIDWPNGFEEIAWMAKTLKHYGYTVRIEAKVFASHDGPQHRVSVVRWEHLPYAHDVKRVEIGTYADKTEAANMIRFLLSIEVEQHRHRERANKC
jgi:hypothetical protein